MMGYPGAGKTTTALTLEQLTGAEHLWADKIRKQMFGQPTHSMAENLELYQHINQQTDQLLAAGKSVIFDTNFNFYKDRQKLRAVATKNDAGTVLLWVQTPKDLAKRRATKEAENNLSRVFGNMSDDVFERLSGHLEEPHTNEHPVIVDGTKVSKDYVSSLLFKK